jgi:hypothetical protein
MRDLLVGRIVVATVALLTVASVCAGQAYSQRIHAGNGQKEVSASAKQKGMTYISEKDFYQNKLFFLDTAYRSYYLKMRSTVPDVKRNRLQVWLAYDNLRAEAEFDSSAGANTYRKFGPAYTIFKLLKMGRDYKLDDRWKGVIRFDSVAVDADDDIGIHLETSDSNVIANKGVYFNPRDTFWHIEDTLWILKPSGQDSTSPTFPLMWRNVYSLPSVFKAANFKMRIVSARDTFDERTSGGRLFTEVLG